MIALGYCNETGLKIFLGLCRQHRYQICQSTLNFLSAILIYVENLLFRTPHQPSVRFSPKLNQMIFRLCWQNVMDFVSIDKTVFAYHSDEFQAWCQNDTSACISAMLWHTDTKLCVCHSHLTQKTPKWFDYSATCWSKVISHLIIILVLVFMIFPPFQLQSS